MSAKKRIVIPILEAGSGHTAPALAIKQEIEGLYPDTYDVHIVPFMKDAGLYCSDLLSKGNWNVQLRTPWFASLNYFLMRKTVGWHNFILFAAMPYTFTAMVRYFMKLECDMILSTHFLSVRLASLAKKLSKRNIPILVVATEPCDPYPVWCDPTCDGLVVANDLARRVAIQGGMPPHKTFVHPFPLRKQFGEVIPDKITTLTQLGLNPDYPCILASAGGWGIGKAVLFAARLCEEGLFDPDDPSATPLNVLIICGKNLKLANKLRNKLAPHPHIHPIILDFASNMAELIHAADILVSKGGASATMEALFMGKPTFFVQWANQPELAQISYSVNHGAAWITPTYTEFSYMLRNTLQDKSYRRKASAAKKMKIKNGAPAIARFAVQFLEQWEQTQPISAFDRGAKSFFGWRKAPKKIQTVNTENLEPDAPENLP